MAETIEAVALPLEVVDGQDLDDALREVLRPGDSLGDEAGGARVLPRHFYRVESWEQALDLMITPHFRLSELINVDVREAPPAYAFPKYVPCAIAWLAAALEVFRQAVGTYVHVAANGGYRTPAHGLTRDASTHCWASAANIYRIGDDMLNDRDRIERYARAARNALPSIYARPYGHGPGEADDHLHLDLGWVVAEPRRPTDGTGAAGTGMGED